MEPDILTEKENSVKLRRLSYRLGDDSPSSDKHNKKKARGKNREEKRNSYVA